MGKTFSRPEALSNAYTHYCPGCTHGVIHRLIAETIDEFGIRGRTVGVAPVGCAVMVYNYIDCDFQEAAHGRAPAMATGIKRVRPDRTVFTYQANGQPPPPGGRNVEEVGWPIKMAELLTTLETPGYITRQTVIKPKYILKAQKAIRLAFEYQLGNSCFSFVELISTCPTNWGMTPVEAVKWAEKTCCRIIDLGTSKRLGHELLITKRYYLCFER